MLDVNGTGRFSGELSVTSGLLSISGGGGTPPTGGVGLRYVSGRLIVYGGTSDITFQKNSNAGANMTILESGNVGIGTSSPANTLDVQTSSGVGSSTASGLARFITAGTTAAISVGQANQTRRLDIGSYYIATTNEELDLATNSAQPILFYTNATERMRITSGGDVGIGTSTFNYASAGTGYLAINGSSSNFLEFQYGTTNTSGWINGNSSTLNLYTSGLKDLLFGTVGTERMRITSGGNVLIGTTTTTNQVLTVYSATAAGQVRVAGAAPAVYLTDTITDPANYVGVLGLATATNNFITGAAAGDLVLLNQASGYRLYVVNYSGGVYLTSGATSWTANSDIRLKNINSHIENAVEKLSTLQTINFSYKDDKFKKQNIGLIAQEVEKIFPELIDKNGDGMLGVRYTELVPVLIKAIQELKLEIETLKNN
jgi:hypothetical protein